MNPWPYGFMYLSACLHIQSVLSFWFPKILSPIQAEELGQFICHVCLLVTISYNSLPIHSSSHSTLHRPLNCVVFNIAVLIFLLIPFQKITSLHTFSDIDILYTPEPQFSWKNTFFGTKIFQRTLSQANQMSVRAILKQAFSLKIE